MPPETDRKPSGSELVFGLLKTLMIGYRLWGAQSSVELSELCGALRTTDRRVGGILAYLANEGLVSLDRAAGTVRLTADGARHLLCQSTGKT